MAEILTTKGLAAALERIIRKGEKEIFLISYSFKIDDTYINRIKQASESKISIKIIYGEKVNKENLIKLHNDPYIEILQYPGLHAKIYANESECIIGSMNFYDYSEQHNTELGCLITTQNDSAAYSDALQHCRDIYKWAKGEPVLKANNIGYCIRTGIKITFNIEKPLSAEAFKSWNKYGDEDYPEKYCHFSGEPSNGETSVNKPILKKNWKKAQELHRL
jgi:phosphatidylserine/phosphatidylglycerophosphate/cardiolipin synthase-like enzyme